MSDARMSLVVGQKRVILEAATVRASSLSTGPGDRLASLTGRRASLDAVDVGMTREAASYIAERGNRLYLWQEPVGHAWLRDLMGFVDPNRGVSFSSINVAGVAILIASDVEPPETLYVSLRRLRRDLRVEWDGETWGMRGDAGGGG
jgi:hypothetical protein